MEPLAHTEQPAPEALERELTEARHFQDQVAGITNDLNNLLAAMKGQAQLACEDDSGIEKDELVRVVLSASLKAEAIIDRLYHQVPSAKTPPPPKEPTAAKQLARILVADDEYTMRDLLGRILQNSGYEVHLASNGQEAIDQSRKMDFDLAFLDFQLGDMQGTDVFRALQSTSPTTHVIFVSGDPNAEEDTKKHAGGRTPTTFIKKPFDIAEVKQRVSYILTMRSALS